MILLFFVERFLGILKTLFAKRVLSGVWGRAPRERKPP
jgi:hypothetical protein